MAIHIECLHETYFLHTTHLSKQNVRKDLKAAENTRRGGGGYTTRPSGNFRMRGRDVRMLGAIDVSTQNVDN